MAADPSKPSLSIVMLTMPGRAAFRRLALECLLRHQDHGLSACELVIALDDGDNLTLDEAKFIVDSGIRRKVVKDTWKSVTDKQNAAVSETTAPWVMLWDDDDWSAPDRIRDTFHAINAHDPAVDIVGPRTIHYHELIGTARRMVKFTTGVHVVDGAAAFRRSLWEQQSFRLLPRYDNKPDPGNVGDWIARRVMAGARVRNTSYSYVAMIHGANTTTARPFRVDPVEGAVLDGPVEYTVVGGRDDVARLIGETTLRRYEAAVKP